MTAGDSTGDLPGPPLPPVQQPAPPPGISREPQRTSEDLSGPPTCSPGPGPGWSSRAGGRELASGHSGACGSGGDSARCPHTSSTVPSPERFGVEHFSLSPTFSTVSVSSHISHPAAASVLKILKH